jgi:hypothetical protein
MKITKVENTNVFRPNSVDVRPPLVEDLINAERISGKIEGVEFTTALISQVTTFDGQAQPPEELRRLSSKDFLSLSAELDDLGVETSQLASSILSGKEGGEKTE